MGANGCAQAHSILVDEGLRAWCILEGSGGVSRAELEDWVASGVDLISTSALNRGVTPLDLSMRVEGGE
jgi:nicotinate-nucleotide pyrophosphorylase